MKSRSSSVGKSAAQQVSLSALLAALLFVSQVSLAAIPNIELVTFLIILYAKHLRSKALAPIAVFIMCEAFIYGFGLWLINYLYIWFVLWAVSLLLAKMRLLTKWSALILSSAYGFLYGALCAIPYFFIGGPGMAFSYWVSGIPFDIIHGIGNAAVVLFLYSSVDRLFSTIKLK